MDAVFSWHFKNRCIVAIYHIYNIPNLTLELMVFELCEIKLPYEPWESNSLQDLIPPPFSMLCQNISFKVSSMSSTWQCVSYSNCSLCAASITDWHADVDENNVDVDGSDHWDGIYLVVMPAGAQRAMAASALKQLLISRCWKISLLVATASGWTSSGYIRTTQVCDARHKHASTLQTNAHASWNPRNNTYVECCLLFMPTIHSGVARIIR